MGLSLSYQPRNISLADDQAIETSSSDFVLGTVSVGNSASPDTNITANQPSGRSPIESFTAQEINTNSFENVEQVSLTELGTKRVKKLDLSNKNLRSLPDLTGFVESLEILIMSDNGI